MTGALGLDVALGRRLWPFWLGWCRVAADQAQTLGPRVQPVALENPPDPVTRDLEAAPLLTTQLQAEAVRPPARLGECQSQDALLDHGRNRIRHSGLAALSRPQQLGPKAHQLMLPAVVGRVVNPQQPAGSPYAAELPGQREQPESAAVDNIIIGQGGASF